MPGNFFNKKCGFCLLYSVMHAALDFTPFSPLTHLFRDLNIILTCRISFETSSLVRCCMEYKQKGSGWTLSVKEM